MPESLNVNVKNECGCSRSDRDLFELSLLEVWKEEGLQNEGRCETSNTYKRVPPTLEAFATANCFNCRAASTEM